MSGARAAACVLVATSVAALTACGGATSSPSPSPARPTSQVQREASRPDPNFDYGFVVQITPDGFHPAWLVAACCQAITWKNLTGATVSVEFDALRTDSGPIAPGAVWSFTPHNVESIAYHNGVTPSMTAVVQVNQPNESP